MPSYIWLSEHKPVLVEVLDTVKQWVVSLRKQNNGESLSSIMVQLIEFARQSGFDVDQHGNAVWPSPYAEKFSELQREELAQIEEAVPEPERKERIRTYLDPKLSEWVNLLVKKQRKRASVSSTLRKVISFSKALILANLVDFDDGCVVAKNLDALPCAIEKTNTKLLPSSIEHQNLKSLGERIQRKAIAEQKASIDSHNPLLLEIEQDKRLLPELSSFSEDRKSESSDKKAQSSEKLLINKRFRKASHETFRSLSSLPETFTKTEIFPTAEQEILISQYYLDSREELRNLIDDIKLRREAFMKGDLGKDIPGLLKKRKDFIKKKYVFMNCFDPLMIGPKKLAKHSLDFMLSWSYLVEEPLEEVSGEDLDLIEALLTELTLTTNLCLQQLRSKRSTKNT